MPEKRKVITLNKRLYFPKWSVKNLCLLAMLTAITTILAIYCTFRIGNIIKIPFKFVSVFITGVLLGPISAGLVSMLGDILNTAIMPVGPFIPAISAIEFLVGFIFGIFFYNKDFLGKGYIIRALLCIILLFLTDTFLTPIPLVGAGYFPSYTVALITRLPAGLIKALLQFVFIIISKGYLKKFKVYTEV